jgi:hypothetical protein
MAMVVVLPAPLPPSSPVMPAARNAKRYAVDRAGGFVELDQLRNLDRRGSCRICRGPLGREGAVFHHAGRSLGHRAGKRKSLGHPGEVP